MTSHDTTSSESLDPATTAAWQEFEHLLDNVPLHMDDPQDGDHLIVQLEGKQKPYLQFATTDGGRHLRVEVSGNAHLALAWQLTSDQCALMRIDGWQGHTEDEPNWIHDIGVGDAPQVTNHLVDVLATRFGLPHPQLLTQHCFGPFTEAIDVASELGLPASQSVIDKAVCEMELIFPEDRAELHAAAGSVLRAQHGDQVVLDDDGDYRLPLDDHPVWVRVRHDLAMIEAFAVVVTDVRSRRQAAIELGLLNRDYPMIKWTMQDRHVIQTVALPGYPFVPAQLSVLLVLFANVLAQASGDLSLRTGGRVAW